MFMYACLHRSTPNDASLQKEFVSPRHACISTTEGEAPPWPLDIQLFQEMFPRPSLTTTKTRPTVIPFLWASVSFTGDLHPLARHQKHAFC